MYMCSSRVVISVVCVKWFCRFEVSSEAYFQSSLLFLMGNFVSDVLTMFHWSQIFIDFFIPVLSLLFLKALECDMCVRPFKPSVHIS